jgi:hypothetical protein
MPQLLLLLLLLLLLQEGTDEAKGEQAVDDVKAEDDRKAAEGLRAGKHAANEADRSAELGKEGAQGVCGGTWCSS